MDIMTNHKKTAISRLGQCRRILSQRFRPLVFSLAILLLLTSAALAQLTTADILGTVTDQTGASVPNANVTLINLGTNDVLQHVPTAQSTAGLQQMVSDFSSASCVHLVTINTHLKLPDTQYHAGAVALNDAIAKLAADNGNVDVIDWDAINADAITKSNPNGLTFDGVHPTADGQSQLESAYSDALEKCGRPWHFW